MCLRCAAFFASLVILSAAAPAGDQGRVAFGRQLFEENWLRPAADDSPLAPTRDGDGLGPLFNGASCVECHRLSGVGGAGPNENNVEVISLILPIGTSDELIREMANRAREIHPAFTHSTNITLHHFGRDANGSLQTYHAFREQIRSVFPAEVRPAVETQRMLGDQLVFELSQRNTPAMFGVGLIDRVPPALVKKLAEVQAKEMPTIAGRAVDDGAGRFGWRCQVSSLDSFVRTACSAELGLRVRASGRRMIQDQPEWPLRDSPNPSTGPLRRDMSDAQVSALMTFVRSLPAPKQVLPEDQDRLDRVHNGEFLFNSIGCGDCHVQDMGPARGIYSDLLLHDMGAVLSDRVAAPSPEPRVVSNISTFSYYTGGGTVPLRTTRKVPPSLGDLETATREFRTPPLWGVADSAPYLHDGRAETLDKAIRLHAGQGRESSLRYEELDQPERDDLVAFLETLRAPEQE